MAVGQRKWCNFVVYISQQIYMQRIYFDDNFWRDDLFPKLEHFYDNCLAPEILHPMHVIGLPIHDLSKE